MQLKVLLPSEIFFENDDVERIVAETREAPSAFCRTGLTALRHLRRAS
jgi:hypothetical protein